MAVTHGMSVDEVEHLAHRLREVARRIMQTASALDREVGSTVWRGPDADRYKHDWWPKHKATLVRVSEDLEGFGQSAAHNASDQRHASDSTGAVGVSTVAAIAVAARGSAGSGDAEAAGQGTAAPASSGTLGRDGQLGGPRGSLTGSGRTWAEVRSEFGDKGAEFGLKGVHQAGGVYDDQCVAWATYRWQELRADAGLELSDLPTEAGWHGGRLPKWFEGQEGATPQLGAMVSYQYGDFGHVMIVEEIGDVDGAMTITVSEFNVPDGSGQSALTGSGRVFTQLEDGRWQSPGEQVHTFTVANH